MSTSAFKIQSSPSMDHDEEFELEEDTNDELLNRLIIPIRDEIASDFSLIGYNTNIRRMEEVLTQRGKQRNVMLYGDIGVGKTAIIHGLVQRKNNNDLSTHMYKREFSRLNTSRLLHTDDVIEINKQFDQALQGLDRYDVLVIENFYNLISYLKTKGANVLLVGLLEALARRKLQCIITCNTRDRTLILNEIPEIHEFFAPEQVKEPNDVDLMNILRGVHRSYETRYGLSITDEAMRTIRDLTQKYRNGMEGWAQPGRALILLDRSIAQFSVRMNSKSPELADIENQSQCLRNEIDSLTQKNGEFYHQEDAERREELLLQLENLKPRLKTLRDEWEKTTAPIQDKQKEKSLKERKLQSYFRDREILENSKKNNTALIEKNQSVSSIENEITRLDQMIRIAKEQIRDINDDIAKINLSDQRDHVVGSEHIANTFSELSGISMKQLTQDERERILNMEKILGKRVFDQPEAVLAVSNAVRRNKAGLTDDEGTPKGSFVFLGPSGVGKTELAKAVTEFVTADEKNMVRIDMSEFMEKHSVSRLIGSPPGYAGYEEGGVLTEAVLAKPDAVVVFDEVEKAHPDIFKILLQVLGDGRLTDGKGVTVDFKGTYVIMTSNAGGKHFLNEELSYEQASVLAMKDVEAILLPEIIGRIDSFICFRRLTLASLEKVAQRRIKKLNKSIEKKKSRLEVSNISAFCETYQDPRYGGRPILKGLKSTLEMELATALLSNENNSQNTVFYADFNDKSFKIRRELAA